MRARILLAVGLLAFIAIAYGCSTSTPMSPGTGTVRVSLTDAPADFDSVVLVIREVAVHRGGPDSSGWSSFVPAIAAHDLLALQNGVFTTLGSVLVGSGHYTQVRLVLDPGSYVVQNGVRRDLIVPSGLQTGLKLIGEFDVPSGGIVDLGIDFDAARSIHDTGNGRLMLRPTARVRVLDVSGAIAGTLSPGQPVSTAYAVLGADSVTSAVADTSGAFVLSLLAPGTYGVSIDAPDGYRDTTISGVTVSAGQTTTVPLITLTPVSGAAASAERGRTEATDPSSEATRRAR
jgi:hypothetical protein